LTERNEKSILALNLVAEQEWEYDIENGNQVTERRIKNFETDLAWMRMLKK